MQLEIEQHPVGLHRLPWLTLALIVACTAILGIAETDTRLEVHSFTDWGVVPSAFALLSALTSPLLHAHGMHLLGAVVVLALVATPLEQRWSGFFLLPLLAAGAMASGTAYAWLAAQSSIPMVGLAGVIAALLGASAVRFRGGWPVTWYWPGAAGLETLQVALPVFALVPVWLLGELAGSVGQYNGVTRGITLWGQVAGFGAGALYAGLVEWTGLEARLFGQAQLRRPEGPHPAIENALIARERGELNEAVSILRDAVAAGAADPALIVHYWEMASFAGKPQQAVGAFQRLIEKELAGGARDVATRHWCELMQRVRDVVAPPRLLLQLIPLLTATRREKEAQQTLQLAACNPQLTPGMALRVVDLAADVDPPCTLRAARIALTSADLHETKRARLKQLVRDLGAQGVREVEPPTSSDEPEAEDRSLELPEDDWVPPVAPQAAEQNDEEGFALSADGSLVGDDLGADLSGVEAEEVDVGPATEAASPDLPAEPPLRDPLPPPPAVDTVAARAGDLDGLGLGDAPGATGLALHGLDLEAEEMEAVGSLIDDTPSTQTDLDPGYDSSGADEDDADGSMEGPLDALDAIAMDVPCDEPRFGDAKIVDAIPIELGPDRLGLQQHGGRRGHVEFARVDAVSVAAVQGLGSRPVVVLDLLANWTSLQGGLLRVIRLRSDQFDARALVPDAPDAGEAFKMLSQILLEQCAAVALPDPLAAVGQPFRVCASLADYEREVLQIDRT